VAGFFAASLPAYFKPRKNRAKKKAAAECVGRAVTSIKVNGSINLKVISNKSK